MVCNCTFNAHLVAPKIILTDAKRSHDNVKNENNAGIMKCMDFCGDYDYEIMNIDEQIHRR